MRGLWRGPQREDREALPPKSGDDVLVAAAQGGNPHAFAQLFDRYQDVVLRFCFYRLGSWDEAGDAAQQTFTEAFAGLNRFRDRDDSFRTWLLRIAHNHVVDLYRRQARRADISLDEAADEAAKVPDPSPSPETLAIAAEQGRQLRFTLQGLPEGERAVMELRLVELTGPEIARVLGLSHEAVRKAQSRAVARLREHMTYGVNAEGGAR
jgi:RNA polymerase sigma-70 factor (ECF subfamily)